MLTDDRRVVLLTLFAQTGASLGLGVLFAPWSPVAALSALAGGMAAVIPNAFLAARLLRPAGHGARALMRSAWVGELGKLALTVVLFGVIFAWMRPLSVPAVFAGFIGAQGVLLAALLLPSGAARRKGKS